jgi:hypothetical protein
MLKDRCEFDRDDYSFNIVNLPHDELVDAAETNSDEEAIPKAKTKKKNSSEESQSTLF